MSLASRARRTALALSVAAVAGAAGLSAAPADAASLQGTLTVTPYSPGYHNVAVFGVLPMTRVEAQRLVDTGHRVQLRLWGEDTFSDDLLMGPYTATIYATDRGLEFHRVRLGIDDDVLDEDWGADELYVGMRLVTPGGTTVRSGETNRAYGSF